MLPPIFVCAGFVPIVDNLSESLSYGTDRVKKNRGMKIPIGLGYELGGYAVNSDEEGGRHDPVRYYGLWSAIAGFLSGGFVIWLMFSLADGF
jgi:hypothetical protein